MSNNRPGTAALAQQLNSLADAHGFDAIQVAAEATGWYWWLFFCTPDDDPCLKQRPFALYPFNPRLTASFKKTYSDPDKTDLMDAFIIADRFLNIHYTSKSLVARMVWARRKSGKPLANWLKCLRKLRFLRSCASELLFAGERGKVTIASWPR